MTNVTSRSANFRSNQSGSGHSSKLLVDTLRSADTAPSLSEQSASTGLRWLWVKILRGRMLDTWELSDNLCISGLGLFRSLLTPNSCRNHHLSLPTSPSGSSQHGQILTHSQTCTGQNWVLADGRVLSLARLKLEPIYRPNMEVDR